MTDKKYVTNNNDKYPVTIVRTDLRGDYPVLIIIHGDNRDSVETLTTDFKVTTGGDKQYIRELKPYEDFVDDEPVMARYPSNSTWYPRHFAGVSKSGRPLTYFRGTKWSSGGETKACTECRRPTTEELK